MTVPVVDAHNDLLLELDHRRGQPGAFQREWLPQLQAGGVALQVCPLYAAEPGWVADAPARVRRQVRAFESAWRTNPHDVTGVASVEDLELVRRGRRIGLMLSMEGVEALGGDPAGIDDFWRLGVRMVSLTHNRRNAFADGLAESEDRGLSERGAELVDRLELLGCMIDLAHASQRTFADVLARRRSARVLVSHTGCRALCDIGRNLDDDQLREVARHGGVVGVMALPFAIDPERPTIDRVADHVEHAVGVVGVEHVGLGGDFFAQVAAVVGAFPSVPGGWRIEGLAGPDGYPALIAALERRGFERRAIARIAADNLLDLFAAALPSEIAPPSAETYAG